MQRERRRDPYPWTWEPPTLIAMTLLLVLVVGVQLARSVANLVAGAGWTWPAADAGSFGSSPIGTAFWTSLPGVLAGNAEAGLAVPAPANTAGPVLLWTVLVITQVLLLGGSIRLIVAGWQRWGPGRMQGMATAAEAEQLLGVTRLRRVAPIVRPDLYDKRSERTTAPLGVAVSTAESVTTSPTVPETTSPWQMRGRNR